MPQKNRLGLERLESRDTPAAFGLPWTDASNLTVSFVPDGLYSEGSSNLFAAMRTNRLSTEVWQGEMLRAIQTWASQANMNVGLVSDDGSAVGTSGASQHDSRFGDIRISMRAFTGGFLAVTTPPGSNDDTLAGDIVLNSNFKFSVGGGANSYSLYTTMLQELGHAFGIGNSTDSGSVMYEWYQGARTGLGTGDASSLQSLYGTRAADSFEDGDGNETIATANAVSTVSGTSTLYTQADINSATDADVFSFSVPGGQSGPVAIKLRTAGLSLLAANLTILDSSGGVVATATATKGGDLTLSQTLTAGQTYYLQVKAASGTFYAAGSYKLSVVFNPSDSDPATVGAPAPTYATDGGSNDTLATATTLTAGNSSTVLADYQVDAAIESSSDVDNYVVQAPSQSSTMLVTVRAVGAGTSPVLSFYDASNNALAATDVSTSGTTRTYQIAGVAADSLITIRAAGTTADYHLAADFHTAGSDMAVVESGTLTSSSPTAYASVTLGQSQFFSLNLQGDTSLKVSVYNAVTQTLVATVTVTGGQTAAESLFLNAGEYSLKYTLLDGSESDYSLRMQTLSDPIGLPLLNGGAGGGTPFLLPSYDYFYHDPTWYEWMSPLG